MTHEDGDRGPGLNRPMRFLLAAYPPWWRQRYADEMHYVLQVSREDEGWSRRELIRQAVGLLRGMVEAWVDPTLVPAGSQLGRTRRQLSGAAWGLLLFGLAGAGFSRVIDDPAMTAANHQHDVLGSFLYVLIAAAVGTAIVMALSAVPSLIAIARDDGRTATRRFAPLLVVVCSAGAFVAALLVASELGGDTAVHSVRHVVAFLLLVVVTGSGGACSTIALLRLAAIAPETRAVVMSHRLATRAVALLTALAALAGVGWVVAAAVETPHLLQTDDGVLATPTLASLTPAIVGLLGAATLLARSAVLGARPTRP